MMNKLQRQRSDAVRFWVNVFRTHTDKHARNRAWRNALDVADRNEGCGFFVIRKPYTEDQLFRVTRTGKRGAVYGRRIYKSRPEGKERVIVGSGITRWGVVPAAF